VDNYSGKETSLGKAQQKSQDIELVLRLDKTHEHREYAPGDHDACDPLARTPFLHQDTAGDLQQEVSPEKDAGAKAEDLVRERQLTFHLQRCIADIHAIKVGNDKEGEEVRDQSPHDPATSAIGDGGRIGLQLNSERSADVRALSVHVDCIQRLTRSH